MEWHFREWEKQCLSVYFFLNRVKLHLFATAGTPPLVQKGVTFSMCVNLNYVKFDQCFLRKYWLFYTTLVCAKLIH